MEYLNQQAKLFLLLLLFVFDELDNFYYQDEHLKLRYLSCLFSDLIEILVECIQLNRHEDHHQIKDFFK